MREILFRGKAIDNNWYYGVPFVFTEDYVCMTAPYTYNKKVEANTIGQYTGLTDKNGKKIFEGDIVKAQDNLIFSPFCDGLVGKVVYIETAFFIEPKDPAKAEYLFNECAVYEVLGNIHDNGELMEER